MPEGVGDRSGELLADRVRLLDVAIKNFIKRLPHDTGIIGLVRTTYRNEIPLYRIGFEPGFGYLVGIRTRPIKDFLDSKFPKIQDVKDVVRAEFERIKATDDTVRVLYLAPQPPNNHKPQKKPVPAYHG